MIDFGRLYDIRIISKGQGARISRIRCMHIYVPIAIPSKTTSKYIQIELNVTLIFNFCTLLFVKSSNNVSFRLYPLFEIKICTFKMIRQPYVFDLHKKCAEF